MPPPSCFQDLSITREMVIYIANINDLNNNNNKPQLEGTWGITVATIDNNNPTYLPIVEQ